MRAAPFKPGNIVVSNSPFGDEDLFEYTPAGILVQSINVSPANDGRDLIVDPGTGSYYGNPAWRTVHRGTRAHPTACVDGVNQSVIGGPFYWSRHATTTVRSVDPSSTTMISLRSQV